MSMDFSDQRLSYEKGQLDQQSIPASPFELLNVWMQQAIEENVQEPYAMSLATCGADNKPSVRIVLLREITDKGIVFYTNYESAKGQDIAENPNVEALFFWHKLERQIRISGSIAKIDADKSAAYFQKRPHDSQVGAWVSQPQSGEVANRDVMEQTFEQLKIDYPEGAAVPTPEFWGGYEITVNEIEFWQGRANRMHDRIVYHKEADGSFSTKRLLP
ncbi:pyridoxamine 5'-phosphate oxidase [Psychrobacter cryohalolentis]|uniref:Pyridoxine/pyridoxamine 5'-phosphate oxidase n=1 Tax=Psychrobacter cryohalolentis (strain ATCC BAA-1226 / DSM 17306 / VKM B-2378 / K5) TaxID=335284 RepID=PDXH_PSYCK|nr:pyridoxamine 5'-phosphate oxidase [Psychrobacter cryohalolentis]Q1QC15.1 RecName: Full=Pyridoxine/pyridoxamine 5'-phosphate oxidase; AltName: Full=PNP/PMP oxidase; Short=PNPOx; AltName: Full=Pyridoxal 5'-phosphate synthase [Psychrobacter cryohalolentis K5]ABE74788.1 Pyridoxamine 5'-phosphate oxidase [Psychrobacter cryohalolentis K5]ASE27397.1 pyridoxine/pyridoxamine 5'-phosphate oxidase [Psychrobacter cryohalolentis]